MNKLNKKGQLSVGKIVILFIGVIVGLALIVAIFNSQTIMTTKPTVVNESDNLASCVVVSAAEGWQINESDSSCNITVTNAPTGWKTTGCPISAVVVKNGTYTALTIDVDYNVTASSGIIRMRNTTDTENLTGNNTYIDYTHCDDGYNKDSGSRTIAGLIGLFCAIALMIFVFVGIKMYNNR